MLIRDDYDAGTLPIYDESDIKKVTKFTKTAWEDVRSQVKVSFPSREKDSSRIAIAQNGATANMLGAIKTADVSFPFCYDKSIANQLAGELSILSTPRFRMTAEFNRGAYNFKPGDVIKFSWAEYGLAEVVMRVQKVDVGSLLDGKIVVDLVQDIFAIADIVFSDPEDTGWVDERPSPENVTAYDITDMPYFFSRGLSEPVPDGEADVIPFPRSPKIASNNFSFLNDTIPSVPEVSELQVNDPSAKRYPNVSLLVNDISEFDGYDTGLFAAGITVDTVDGKEGAPPLSATVAEIRTSDRGLIYTNDEWMAYESVTDNMDGSYTLGNIRRGLLGTQAKDHTAGQQVSFFDQALLGQGFKDLVPGDTIYFKFLDAVGQETLIPAAATENSYLTRDVADRPLRPRLIQLDLDRNIDTERGGNSYSMTWTSSNREELEVTFEDDATQTPDITETYDLEIWVDGAIDLAYSETAISSPHTLDLSTLTNGSQGELRLYSRRTDGNLKSSLYYASFKFNIQNMLLLSGDANDTGDDYVLLSGDANDSGTGRDGEAIVDP